MKRCGQKECPYYPPRKQVRFLGRADVDIVLVGESPGRQEEIDGRPFVGRSGHLLDVTLSEVGIYREDVFLANAAMCKLDKDALTPKQLNDTLKLCRPHIEFAIKAIKPKIVVAVGDIAMKQLIKLSGGILKRHGTFTWSEEFGCYVFCTYHPAFCLRQPSRTPEFKLDFQKLRRFLDNGFEIPKAEAEFKCIDNINDILPLQAFAISLDTETQGLDPLDPNSFLISYSFSDGENSYQVYLHELGTEEDYDFVVDWFKKSGKKITEKKLYVKRVKNFTDNLHGLLELVSNPSIKKYMFNGIFDLRFIYEARRREYGMNNLFHKRFAMDVQSLAHLIDENLYSKASLESVQKGMTNIDSQYSQEFDKQYDKSNMIEVPHDELTKYACLDAHTTYQCAVAARAKLGDDVQLAKYFVNFVMPTLSQSLFTITSNGCLIDRCRIPEVKGQLAEIASKEHEDAIACIPTAVKTLHEDKLRLSRTALIRDTLYGKDGFEIESRTPTAKGTPSVGKKARSAIPASKMSKQASNFIRHYEAWGAANKLITTYIKGFEESIRHDGRIHPIYSAVTTVTGRTSTVSPSLNLPKRGALGSIIRTIIAAPVGRVLIGVDASQNELRFMAELSGDEAMRRVYQTDGDIHTNTALALLGKTREEVDDTTFKTARTSSKSLNFGLLYGMQAPGYRKYAKMEYGIDLSIKEAEDARNIFFRTYPGIAQYHEDVIKFAHDNGYVVSPFGRIRRFPEINSYDEGTRNRAERQSLNHAIQSAASDTVLSALTKMIQDDVLDSSEIIPIMFIHDELVFECDENKIDKYIPIITHYMEHPPLEEMFGFKPTVPMKAEAKIGPNYGSMKEYVAGS